MKADIVSAIAASILLAWGGAAATIAAAEAVRDKLEGVPLVWKPKMNVSKLGVVDLTGLADTKLQIERCTDRREDTALIGMNREKATPRKVSTPDDVPSFVTSRVKELVSGAGINVVDSGGNVILKCELKQFYVEETNTYNGDVRLLVTLTDRSGKVLWTGLTAGGAKRFGRSYKAENYYETLSDSLMEATYRLMQTSSFHSALAGKA